jgi:hypothetical protein
MYGYSINIYIYINYNIYIAEILSLPGENSRAPPFHLCRTCAEKFPATDGMQQRPSWSRVENTDFIF